MSEQFGDDFITITDEDGREYELEVLSTLDYNGAQYLAVCPADVGENDEAELEVSILKVEEEDGEEILCAVTDDDELEEVYGRIIDRIYEDGDDEEEAEDEDE